MPEHLFLPVLLGGCLEFGKELLSADKCCLSPPGSQLARPRRR